jgi:hypothetical protein
MPELIRTSRATALLSVGYAVAGYLLTLGVIVYAIGSPGAACTPGSGIR